MTFEQNDIPHIRIHTVDADILRAVQSAIEACCTNKGFTAKDIAEIAEFRNDGVSLKLNYGEGMHLFKDDALLNRELGLFAANAVHTEAQLKDMNAKYAARGITVSREPSLDKAFHDVVQRAERNIVNVAPDNNIPRNFDEAFERDVVVVGEIHRHESPRLTIAQKLPELGEKRGALLVEHLYANRQNNLNDWLASPAGTEMPPLLKLSVDSIKGEKQDYYGTKRLIEDAKAAGIKVFGYETDATLANNYQTIEKNESLAVKFGNSEEYPRGYYEYRILTMNEAARECIAQAQQQHGKIVMSTGRAHAISGDAKGLPGVADFFGGAAVVVEDAENGKPLGSAVTNRFPEWRPEKTAGDFLFITADPEALKHRMEQGKTEGIDRFVEAAAMMTGRFGEPKSSKSDHITPTNTPDARGHAALREIRHL